MLIHFINLDRRKDRDLAFRQNNSPHVEVARVRAIDAKTIEPADLRRLAGVNPE